jgi:sugar lactone lactonase YvrE
MTKRITAPAMVMAMGASLACNGPGGPSEVRTPTIYATAEQGSVLVRIDPATAAATVVGPLNVSGAFALARRSDGVLFTITDSGFTPSPNARAATVNPRTGGATVFGQEFGEYLRMMGLAFGRDGTLYGSSPITQSLYRIDLTTGKPVKIGPFGVNGIMDLAMDADDGLWANTQTAIYRVDPASGEATLAVRVTGASMLMGITFDASGGLLATTYEPQSMLYRIDLATGAASMVGSTGLSFVHSAEFFRGR